MSFPLGLGPFLAKTEWFCITTDFSGRHSRAIWDSGQYRNLFTELGGYTQAEVDAKIEKMKQHLFFGDNKTYGAPGWESVSSR